MRYNGAPAIVAEERFESIGAAFAPSTALCEPVPLHTFPPLRVGSGCETQETAAIGRQRAAGPSPALRSRDRDRRIIPISKHRPPSPSRPPERHAIGP